MAPHNTSSTEQNFRNNLSQFAWARGSTNDLQPSQQQQSQPRQSGNPFARFYNAVAGDYIPLRSNERSNEDEAWLALSRWERLLGFGACLLGAAVCFFVAFITMLRPSKFALSFSLGSLLVMIGFSVLIGPINHLKHLSWSNVIFLSGPPLFLRVSHKWDSTDCCTGSTAEYRLSVT
ncbi:ER-to-golgi vesicle protein transport Sft2 [Lentinula edodes]|uniref:Protein transport protein SFT2 n=1 Tax=Lentinula edodes TaxID=5353 RepID=A0A1Q3E2Y6_LENED|nr:ER-to-golgi vesicle protein transport Sft2 [Lentinula edodes]